MKRLLILLLALFLIGCQQNTTTTTPTTSVSPLASSSNHSNEEGSNAAQSATTDASTATTADATGIYQLITGDQIKERMDAGETIMIVDVRTKEEFDAGHIPGAILIPNETIGASEPSELPNKDAVIVVYCRSGRRSMESANKLLKLGYKNIYDLGGIGNWPYETEKTNP